MNGRRLALSALVSVAVLMSGCSGPPDPVETTPAFATEDEAFAAAEATYRAYVDALNQVDLSDPETFEPVFALTTGELLTSDKKNFSQWHADGYDMTGLSFIESIERIAALLPYLDTKVTLRACYDVGDVSVQDKDGNSVVDANRPAVQRLTVTLVSAAQPSPHLLVSAISPADEATC